ncbi:MAG: hypothetical protein ACPG51_10755 [Thiolinea sp.]
MFNRVVYPWWKQICFWGVWLLLLAPGYCAAFGAWLIGSMLPGYHDPVDITLTVIMVVTLFSIMLVAVYTSWHFIKASRGFSHLMLSLLLGILVIPVVSALGAIFSYVQLA